MGDVNHPSLWEYCLDFIFAIYMLVLMSIGVLAVFGFLWMIITPLVDLFQYLTRGRDSVPKPATDYGAMDKIEV